MSKIYLPIINGLNKFECAKYVRLAAFYLSGANYIPSNGWNFGYINKVVFGLEGLDYINEKEKHLIPGFSVVG